MLSYITWNVDPEIFQTGGFAIRWYGLLFALSFVFAYYVLLKVFIKEKLSAQLLDKLAVYIFIGTVLGARIGHCLFYEPTYYLANPLEMIKIWKGGLASHGGAIGILLAVFLFVKKHKFNFLWMLDRVVIVVALVGVFIRVGNLMNSEIIGDKTTFSCGFLFVNEFDRSLTNSNENLIHYTEIEQTGQDTIVNGDAYQPIKAKIAFTARKIKPEQVKSFIRKQVIPMIQLDRDMRKNFKLFHDPEVKLDNKNNKLIASFHMHAVPRHPSQVYEALAYLFMFIILYLVYLKKRSRLKNGQLFGWFLIALFGFRFLIEYVKEVQVPFENDLPLYMGQILSIPFIIIGIIILLTRKKAKENSTE